MTITGRAAPVKATKLRNRILIIVAIVVGGAGIVAGALGAILSRDDLVQLSGLTAMGVMSIAVALLVVRRGTDADPDS